MFGSARTRKHAFRLVIVAATLAAASGVGVAVASIPDAGGVIHACYKKSTHGELHLVNSASDCNPSEKAIAWNQTGPQGPPGTPGAPGTPGKTFLAGSSGGQEATGTGSGTGCGDFIGVGSCSSTQAIVEQVVPVSATLHDLYVHLSAAPGVGVHEKWQINVNNSGTSLACDIDGTATTCNNTTVSFPVNAGDTVTLEVSETTIGGAAPAAVTWAVQVS